MKQTDNRQNKLIQIKAETKHFPKDRHLSSERNQDENSGLVSGRRGGAVFGLVSNLLMASKIAQSAKHCHLAVHNFDKSAPLVEHAKQKLPILIILDWDGCEAEAFKVLKELGGNADLKGVASVGYLSQMKTGLVDEARKAGCHRVYTKSEFTRDLENILARYAA